MQAKILIFSTQNFSCYICSQNRLPYLCTWHNVYLGKSCLIMQVKHVVKCLTYNMPSVNGINYF